MSRINCGNTDQVSNLMPDSNVNKFSPTSLLRLSKDEQGADMPAAYRIRQESPVTESLMPSKASVIPQHSTDPKQHTGMYHQGGVPMQPYVMQQQQMMHMPPPNYFMGPPVYPAPGKGAMEAHFKPAVPPPFPAAAYCQGQTRQCLTTAHQPTTHQSVQGHPMHQMMPQYVPSPVPQLIKQPIQQPPSGKSRMLNMNSKMANQYPCLGQQTPALPHNSQGVFVCNSVRKSLSSEVTHHVTSLEKLEQEVPRFVPKTVIQEIVREVPKYDMEYVDKIVEVPHQEYRITYQEVEEEHIIPRYVPKIDVIEVPREEVKYVPKIETNYVEKITEVPSKTDVRFTACPVTVDTPFLIPQFNDNSVPVVMSHTVIPEIEENDSVYEVDAYKYVPYLVPVDVYIPRPVNIPLCANDTGVTKEVQNAVIPQEQLQQIMIQLNPHLLHLEDFNTSQEQLFQSHILEAKNMAASYKVKAPEAISAHLTTADEPLPHLLSPSSCFHQSEKAFHRGHIPIKNWISRCDKALETSSRRSSHYRVYSQMGNVGDSSEARTACAPPVFSTTEVIASPVPVM